VVLVFLWHDEVAPEEGCGVVCCLADGTDVKISEVVADGNTEVYGILGGIDCNMAPLFPSSSWLCGSPHICQDRSASAMCVPIPGGCQGLSGVRLYRLLI
jgi:hypothetical protein